MRRLSVDSGNDNDDDHHTNHHHHYYQPQRNNHHHHHRKQQFKSKTSDLLDPSATTAAAAAIGPHHPGTHPGLPRKRRLKGGGKRRGDRRRSCCEWVSSCKKKQQQRQQHKVTTFGWTLWLAVALWYTLGVVSIATSKVLLLPIMSHHYNMTSAAAASATSSRSSTIGVHMSPLALTLQQLLIGSTLLRCLLFLRGSFRGSAGLQPWPPLATISCHSLVTTTTTTTTATSSSAPNSMNSNGSNYHHTHTHTHTTAPPRELLWASICFALGFLATNFGFAGSAASFVETVKAAEPLTSATVAACYGIESISAPQKASLGTIVAGVLLATLGNSSGSHASASEAAAAAQPLAAMLLSSAIVMTSNLCFSFRGLYQKLFRKVASTHVLDDLNLQYRMQWTGVLLLVGPVLVFDLLPTFCWKSYPWSTTVSESGSSPVQFLILAIINGCAFTSYNLASTFILSRISVVHHAALNCLRRVFAIVMTSLLFGVPITVAGAIGIALAMAGFMLYTHYKIQQQQQQQRWESIRVHHHQHQHRSQGSFGRSSATSGSTVLPLNGKLHV